MKLVLQGTSMTFGDVLMTFRFQTSASAHRFFVRAPVGAVEDTGLRDLAHDQADREAARAFVKTHTSELRLLGVLR
jgi:hypothetical protein